MNKLPGKEIRINQGPLVHGDSISFQIQSLYFFYLGTSQTEAKADHNDRSKKNILGVFVALGHFFSQGY